MIVRTCVNEGHVACGKALLRFYRSGIMVAERLVVDRRGTIANAIRRWIRHGALP